MLSGEVKIREQVVVSWEAEYVGPTEGWPGHSNYRVQAVARANGRDHHRTFILPHNRNDGPYVLTANIMTDLRVMNQES